MPIKIISIDTDDTNTSLEGLHGKQKPPLFIKVFSRQCGHCIAMENEWDNLEEDNSTKNVTLVSLDVGRLSNCGLKGNVLKNIQDKATKGVPLIVLVKPDGTIHEFSENERTKDNMAQFLIEKLSNTELNSRGGQSGGGRRSTRKRKGKRKRKRTSKRKSTSKRKLSTSKRKRSTSKRKRSTRKRKRSTSKRKRSTRKRIRRQRGGDPSKLDTSSDSATHDISANHNHAAKDHKAAVEAHKNGTDDDAKKLSKKIGKLSALEFDHEDFNDEPSPPKYANRQSYDDAGHGIGAGVMGAGMPPVSQ